MTTPNWQIRKIKSHDRTFDLRVGFLPGRETTRRAIVFLNGRAEWIEKYDHLPDDLKLPDDCGFLTLDHRGQGASGGARSWVKSYDDYILDAAGVISEVIGTIPYALLSHSMGGLIAMYGTLRGILTPQSLVQCSPLFRLPPEPIPPWIGRPVSKVVTAIGLGRLSTGGGAHHRATFAKNKLTSSKERYAIIQKSPYLLPPATFGWAYETLVATRYIFTPENMARLSSPTLFLSGTQERVVDPTGSFDWVQLAHQNCQADVRLEIIEGAKHELLYEREDYYGKSLALAKDWFKPFLR